jgi:radical SAM superfamily enzyme YgiQ (UPF0313 family)
MRILLYVPDNQVTNNFIPQLWPFVLKRHTPAAHQVTIVDGNTQHLTEQELTQYIRVNDIELVGMGFMTRMAQKAYRMADAVRASTGVPIVMGGPHVTEVPDEPLGRNGRPRHADSVVLGEAEDLWPLLVADAAEGKLREIYEPILIEGKSAKPTLLDYPIIEWSKEELVRFDLMRFIPPTVTKLLKALNIRFDHAYVIPVESGRGCPYGCDFCTVTSFFGGKIRFRTNESVIEELLALKALGKSQNALVSVFFVDDNFAINRKRIKSLLREMILRDACLPWTGQISINLLRDEELVELIARSGARWIFIGLESINPASLKEANKGFNRPEDYSDILNLLARYGVYAITSFIFGMEGDQCGIACRTFAEIDNWPPGLPVFGILTPYPGTPLYSRLEENGRLTRPEHWLDFQAFRSTYLPRNLSAEEVEREVHDAWAHCYKPEAFRRAQQWLLNHDKGFVQQVVHFVARLLFRGIYFQQISRWAWIKLLAQNAPTLTSLVRSGIAARSRKSSRPYAPAPATRADEILISKPAVEAE